MQMLARHSSRSRTHASARLAVAAGLPLLLPGLLPANAPTAAAARSSACPPEHPSFVVIQTDDETLDQLYSVFNAGGVEIPAMPNTLSLIAGRGITFNRYYVSY